MDKIPEMYKAFQEKVSDKKDVKVKESLVYRFWKGDWTVMMDAESDREAVSYTHLDVYKRQHLSCRYGKRQIVYSSRMFKFFSDIIYYYRIHFTYPGYPSNRSKQSWAFPDAEIYPGYRHKHGSCRLDLYADRLSVRFWA